MNLILKGRLKLLADKVPKCDVAADIGTDHAYIPIYLIQQGICKKAIASDVRIGPVRVANKNINLYKMNDRIEARLGSGLDTLSENEADAIIIAGMGGTLLSGLLNDNAEKACKAASLILQPMNDLDMVREWLLDHKFDIYDEELAAEGEKIYCVISARYDGQDRDYQSFQLHVGEKLIEKKDPLLPAYCEIRLRQTNRILSQLEAMEDNKELLGYYSQLKTDYMGLINRIR
ncbi:tRNA (adenine22-N1)-methyltransferase [Ruminiclostridium sufflavum DSM 19573]|uniref:tRNA (Adenine22-N1)-methyltransferase n=1 Tax=Ruminiclostridium sufflavum DSM 19573 TaxID=1121337 RepID=A0A318XKP1_9FIRM|nr:class I SAM-dependent methyltransferase [Ruminiclostridium sufflavum]PYG87028.1 tRNA (adenine22-N1)-methyltransferase [Ruminiclostridium sufflavum DSM 19573]